MNFVVTVLIFVAALAVIGTILLLVTRTHYRAWRFGLFFESEDRRDRHGEHPDDPDDQA